MIDKNILKEKFIELFGDEPKLFNSPGRINLIGEHTDYNNGFVLPAAIDKSISIAILPNTSEEFHLYSIDFDEHYSFNTDSYSEPVNNWPDYIMGVILEFLKLNKEVQGFNCVFGGDIPLGAGLSSSAALECVFAFAINEMNSFELEKMELVKLAQNAENNFAGVKCGIMDQFASMFGKEGQVMLLDCRSLDYEYFNLSLPEHDVILIDTQVKHSLASSEYNTRRLECEAGVKAIRSNNPEVQSLRDADMNMLDNVKTEIEEKVYNRCKYVIEEISRTVSATQDLKKGDVEAFGKKMYETHYGLSKLYEVSCAELDFLVERAEITGKVTGARMMGGGFGGCTINLVEKDYTEGFIKIVKEDFNKQFGKYPDIYRVKISEGTQKLID